MSEIANKYIIKNCPDYIDNGYTCCWTGTHKPFCPDCTDCVMKQIARKCKKEIDVYRNTQLPNDGANTLHFGRQSFAYDILKLLDIQEAE